MEGASLDENGNVDGKSKAANLEKATPVKMWRREEPIVRTPIKPDPIKIRGICVDTYGDNDVKRPMEPVEIQLSTPGGANKKLWAQTFYQVYQTKQSRVAMEDNQMLTDENIAMRGRINDLMLTVDELKETKASLQKEAAQSHEKVLQMEAENERLRQALEDSKNKPNVSAFDETKSLPSHDVTSLSTPPGQTKLVGTKLEALEKKSATSLQLQNGVGSHNERLQRGAADLYEKHVGCTNHHQRHQDVEEPQEKFHFRARPVPNYEAIGRLPQVPKKEATKVKPFSFGDRPTLSNIRRQQKSKETTARVAGMDH